MKERKKERKKKERKKERKKNIKKKTTFSSNCGFGLSKVYLHLC